MIENSSLLYVFITFIFMSNFIASVLMTHIVVSRLKMIKDGLYYWIFGALAFEGMIALASFYPVLNPDDRMGGIPVSIWLNALYALATATIYGWVIVFHLSSQKWKT